MVESLVPALELESVVKIGVTSAVIELHDHQSLIGSAATIRRVNGK